jgi:hypothetical protein
MAPIQVSQANTNQTPTIKQEPGTETSNSNQSNQSNTNSAANTGGQTVLANIQLPNGQIGQLISAPVWPTNSLNIFGLSGLSFTQCLVYVYLNSIQCK